MFSKKLTILILSVVSLLSNGCSNNHNFIDPKTIVSLAYDTNCLDKLEPDFKLYKLELLSDEKIEEDFKCLRDALDYLKLRVEGDQADKFTSLEMERLLNKILFIDNPKSAAFYKNLIEIKAQIFGGDASHLTFRDFDNLKIFLDSIESTAKVIKPFASELFFEETFMNPKDVETAVRPLALLIDKWVNFTNENINLITVFNLISDAGVEIKSKNNWVAVFNLLREAESKEEVVLNKDKDKLVDAAQKYYSVILNLYRTLDKDWEYKRGDFFDLSREIKGAVLTLQSTLRRHPMQAWSESDLLPILNLISDFELLDQEISQDVREHIIKVIFGKWFDLQDGSIQLSDENLRKIEHAWSEVDSFIVDSRPLEGYVGKTFPYVKKGTSNFALFTQQRWPSLVREDRSLLIPDYEPDVTFSFQSLFHVAWQFTVARILVEAYTGDDERLRMRTGLSIEEVEEVYLDIFVFLKEIDFLGEESRGGWFRIFNEGNLFVPSADPDGYVNISEAADYAAYMFSAIFMGANVSDSIQTVCPNFVEKCSFAYIQTNPEVVFEALPGLIDYFANGLSERSYQAWQVGFEYIAKLDNNDENYESSHWFRGTVANQYNEVIYRKYDLDGSDTLSFEEVSAAFIDFKAALKLLPQVKGTANEDKDDVLKSFLTLFVKDGKLPKLRNGRPSGSLIRHVLVCGSVQTSYNKECVFESDRSKIMALLAFLTSI